MEILLEDGPFAGDTFRVDEIVFDSGYVLVSESTRQAELADRPFPRTGRYQRRRYWNGAEISHRWMWDGWH